VFTVYTAVFGGTQQGVNVANGNGGNFHSV